jgi:ABC-type Fe3+/spermidine/putrescine transport system ATPase subunit
VADFLGVSNLMEVEVVERGPGSRCLVRLGETSLAVDRGEVDALGPAHAVIRPERVRIEPYREAGQLGENRVPAMVERLAFLGASTQVMLRLAPGALLQVTVPNDGTEATLSQGTPVHAFLAPDALRVLGGATREVPLAEDEHLIASPSADSPAGAVGKLGG